MSKPKGRGARPIVIPYGHPTYHAVPHNSEFCKKCVHETYCEECRSAFAHHLDKMKGNK